MDIPWGNLRCLKLKLFLNTYFELISPHYVVANSIWRKCHSILLHQYDAPRKKVRKTYQVCIFFCQEKKGLRIDENWEGFWMKFWSYMQRNERGKLLSVSVYQAKTYLQNFPLDHFWSRYRPWSSRINYFENNRQISSIHL